MKKRLCILLTLLLLLTISVRAHEIPDETRPGSITLRLSWEGELLDGGSLTLYRVGQIAASDGNYTFAPVDALLASGVALDTLEDPALAAQLAALARQHALTPISAPVENGEAKLTELQPGLYVVTQSTEEACDGFAPLAPFLLSLPQWDGEGYVYDITAKPKVGLEIIPPETTEPTEPTEPSDPDLPDTGQLQWPIPVMAASGLGLFVLGLALCLRKREHHAQ